MVVGVFLVHVNKGVIIIKLVYEEESEDEKVLTVVETIIISTVDEKESYIAV